MHFILSGAYKRAMRWRWVSVSPIGQTEPPPARKPKPGPPTPAEAARILNEAWRDPDWRALLWVAMTTGARRGELCAIRWSSVSLEAGRETIWLRHAIRKDSGRLVEAELKTHQQRRLALDPETVAVLKDHRDRRQDRAAALGLELRPDGFVFSGAPDGTTFSKPDAVTHRYDRLASRLGIATCPRRLTCRAAVVDAGRCCPGGGRGQAQQVRSPATYRARGRPHRSGLARRARSCGLPPHTSSALRVADATALTRRP
jgi:integrase